MTRHKPKQLRLTESPPLELAGLIETADPETGAAETMRFYLPAGVTADDLGLQRVMPCGDGP